jgi:hypothetical protein
VSQRVGGFERRPRYVDHDEHAQVVMDLEGLRVLVVESGAIEVWARGSSASAFEKILHEPWSIARGAWDGDDLELCRADKTALRVSFRGAPASWRTVAKGSCPHTKTPGAGTQRSRDGAWTAKVETRSECTHVRMAPDDCTYFHDALVEGPRAAPKTLHGGDTVPALSPSGRFLVFQDLKGPLVVYDTTSRALLPTSIGKNDWLRHWILWLPDESAFGVVSEDGGVDLVSPTTGGVRRTLDLPGVSRSSNVAWLGAGDGEIVAIVERDAQLLRLSDGVVLHVEPPSSSDSDTPVLWTETGLVDGSPAELASWVFRPAGGFAVVAAAGRRHAGLWRDFRDNKPLP